MADDQKRVWDLDLCKNIDLLREAGRIIIYGAAEKGKYVLSCLRDADIEVSFLCDMDMGKWGSHIDGVKVISPFELKSVKNESSLPVYIIACIQQSNDLLILLDHSKLEEIRVITYWGVRTAIHMNAESLYARNPRRAAFCQIEKDEIRRSIFNNRLHNIYRFMTSPSEAIWVLQPGKTASTSLEVRLEKCRVPFIKMHSLEYTNHILGEDYRNVWDGWVEERKNSHLKVIVAVREPLARDYSAFWQLFSEDNGKILLMPVLHNDFQRLYDNYAGLIMKGSAYRNEMLGELSPITWNDEFEWLDDHIKKHLGIDVFSHPFDRERGYTIIHEGNIELLLFKVEKLESLMDEIGAFVGVGKLPAINANTADAKWYGLAYSQFRKEVKLPGEYVRHYYRNNAKMDHFYTPEEKAGFLARWSRNMEDGVFWQDCM